RYGRAAARYEGPKCRPHPARTRERETGRRDRPGRNDARQGDRGQPRAGSRAAAVGRSHRHLGDRSVSLRRRIDAAPFPLPRPPASRTSRLPDVARPRSRPVPDGTQDAARAAPPGPSDRRGEVSGVNRVAPSPLGRETGSGASLKPYATPTRGLPDKRARPRNTAITAENRTGGRRMYFQLTTARTSDATRNEPITG